MNLLVDTHLLLWAAIRPDRLSAAARRILQDEDATLCFSPASLVEVAIKAGLGRDDFDVDPKRLRRGLVDNKWRELAFTGEHAVAMADLPPLHKDPFDRMLLAQAQVEGMVLLTSDAVVARYPGDVRKV